MDAYIEPIKFWHFKCVLSPIFQMYFLSFSNDFVSLVTVQVNMTRQGSMLQLKWLFCIFIHDFLSIFSPSQFVICQNWQTIDTFLESPFQCSVAIHIKFNGCLY